MRNIPLKAFTKKSPVKHKSKPKEVSEVNHPGPGWNPKDPDYHTGHKEDGTPIPMKSPMKDSGTQHYADLDFKNKPKAIKDHDKTYGPGHTKHGKQNPKK